MNRRQSRLMLVCGLIVVASQLSFAAPVQWEQNGHYYQLTELMSWSQAEEQAIQWGGHLVTINDRQEELWLRMQFGSNEYFWIGFNDINSEGNWEWVSGEPVTYTNWWQWEPNNQGADGEIENAAIMNWGGAQQIDGEWFYYYGDGWNDNAVDNEYRGIVEIKFLKPVVSIIKAKMVKIPSAFAESGLGVDLHVQFPPSDNSEQYRYVRLQGTVNGQFISEEFNVSGLVAPGETKDIMWNAGQFIGEPLIVLDFEAAGVPRFEANEKFDLTAEAWTSDGIEDGIMSDPNTKSVEIYLPVVIVHGYLFPGVGKRLFSRIVAPAIYGSLANYLQAQDPSVKDPTREPFITGYTTDTSPYQTIWRRDWQMSWTPRQVADWLHDLISDVRIATYASRVNIISHSTGGLIARYYACDADGLHPDGPTRVHKLIMIATPNWGVSKFYMVTSNWSAQDVQNTAADEPVGLWVVPRCFNGSREPIACIYDSKTGEPIWPNPAIVRPTSDFKYPEQFPDQTSSPAGVTYYTIFSQNILTPYLFDVTPTKRDWYRVKSIKVSEPGDDLVVESSAQLPSAISVPAGATRSHASLPADPEVQSLVLEKLRD